MLSIYTEHNKQPITYTYTAGQNFPDIKGKLLRLELSGKELIRLTQVKDIPINAIDNSHLIWYGRFAGGILKLLREIYLC